MKPSYKLARIRTIILGVAILVTAGMASDVFVSSSQTVPPGKDASSESSRSFAGKDEIEEGDPRDREKYWEMRRGGITPREIAAAQKQAERLPQASALPRTSGALDDLSGVGIDSVEPGGSPWVSFGPSPINSGGATYAGRVPSIAVDPVDPNTVYAGGANGGVWKSISGGNSWTPMNGESAMASLAIGSIAIDPNNRNIIYAGTGEPNGGSSHVGRGVLKSTNGGGTWTVIGDADPFTIGGTTTYRVLVSPTSTVWVACNLGLYRSSDGGITWKKTKPVTGFANGRVFDVAMSADGNRMYAVVDGVGLFRSQDGASSWTQVTSGLTGVNWFNRSRVAIARSNSSVAYLIVNPVANSSYVTSNGGNSWSQMAFVDPGPTYGGYSLEVGVDPADANTVYVLGFSVWVNTGGTFGGSWNFVTNPHPDHHAIAFPPCSGSPCPYYLGDDGGVFYVQPVGSATNVSVASKNTNLVITEFTGGDLGINFVSDPRAIGGSQDNGTEVFVRDDPNKSNPLEWTQTLGGDGGYAYLDHDPSFRNFAYTEYQSACGASGNSTCGVFRSDFWGYSWSSFSFGLDNLPAFFYPFYVPDRLDRLHLAYAVNGSVYENVTASASWYRSSQVLPSTPTAIAIAPSNSAVIYAGVFTGTVFRTAAGHSGGPSTYESRSGGLPAGYVVNSISVDSTGPDVVYIAGSLSGSNVVFKTTNGGVSWTNISGNLPSSLPAFSIITYFAGATRVIVIGTDAGVFFTTNEGQTWSALNNGLPRTKIAQVAIDRDQTTIAAFTGGRGAFSTNIGGGPACTYSTSPTSQNFTASGGSSSFTVNAPSGCGWTATSDAAWLTVTSGATGSGNGTVGYSVMSNGSTSSRTGHINLPNQTIFTVTQAGVNNQSPVANPGGPYSGSVAAAIQFNGTGSFDPDGSIVSYQWNFGDSTFGSGSSPSHTYSAAGTYNVTLTVTDNGGAAASASTTANIGASRSPFNGPHNIPGILQVEDFDNGGEGVAYHDLTPGNDWGQYRSTGVDIANSTGIPGDFDVANAYMSEWLEYTVNVNSSGTYDIQAYVASGGPGGTFHYAVDGVNKGSVTVLDTGSWGNFQAAVLANVSLSAGQHILRVELDANGFQQFPAVANFNYFNFVASGGGSSPPVAHWKFDEGGGTVTADSSGNNIKGTLLNGPVWTAGRSGNGLSFDGLDDRVAVTNTSSLSSVVNTFTIAFWAYPLSTHEIDGEGTDIFAGVFNQRYAIGPQHGWQAYGSSAHAGAGVSVGTNGVSVYEHSDGYMPAMLVHQGSISGWTHITVIYENRQPRLYINGSLVRTGLTSTKSFVHTVPIDIGGMNYGFFNGRLDEMRIYNRVLTVSEIQNLVSTGMGPVAHVKPGEGSSRNLLDILGQMDNTALDMLGLRWQFRRFGIYSGGK